MQSRRGTSGPIHHRLTIAALALGLAVCSACDQRDAAPAEEPVTTQAPTTDVDEATREQLSQLGYLDAAPEKAQGESGVVVHDAARAYPGYGLFTTRSNCLAELIDMEGTVVHSWQATGCRFWSNAELQANGDLLVTGMYRGESGSRPSLNLVRLGFTGEPILKVPIGAHHDAELLADGRILTLTQRPRRIPEISSTHILDDAIAVVAPDGKVLEALSLADLLHNEPDDVTLRIPAASKTIGGLLAIDLIHANSVERIDRPDLLAESPIYAPGNVLFCSQAQSVIGVADLETGELLWSWGQGELSGPHHPTLLRSGNILVFDNGIEHERSRVLEIDPRAPGGAEIVWSYQAPEPSDFFTRSRGSVQRLPNGNTLIANSDAGIAFEVTSEGETVWEFRNPHLDDRGHRATIVRMRRYPPMLVEALLAR